MHQMAQLGAAIHPKAHSSSTGRSYLLRDAELMQASLEASEAEPELYFMLQKTERNSALQQVAPAGGSLGAFGLIPILP